MSRKLVINGVDPNTTIEKYEKGKLRKITLDDLRDTSRTETAKGRSGSKVSTGSKGSSSLKGSPKSRRRHSDSSSEEKPSKNNLGTITKTREPNGALAEIMSLGLIQTDEEKKRCFWCRTKYYHPSIGVIMKRDCSNSLVETERGTRIKRSVYNYWYNHYPFCCLNCNLAYCIDEQSKISPYRNINFQDSVRFVKELNLLLTGEELKESPHYSLYIKNGGLLTKEQFFVNPTYYREMPGVFMHPAKINYRRFDKNKLSGLS